MATLLERISEIIKAKGYSPRSFAITIGFNYSTLNNYLTGRRTTIDYELVEKTLMSIGDISAEWLLRGKGTMLLSETTLDSNLERMNRLVDTITTLQGTINEQMKTIKSFEEKTKRLEAELAKIKSERKIG